MYKRKNNVSENQKMPSKSGRVCNSNHVPIHAGIVPLLLTSKRYNTSNIRHLISSMSLDDMLEASRISTLLINGGVITGTSSQKAKTFSNIVVRQPKPYAQSLINNLNNSIVLRNSENNCESESSKELYNNLMNDD